MCLVCVCVCESVCDWMHAYQCVRDLVHVNLRVGVDAWVWVCLDPDAVRQCRACCLIPRLHTMRVVQPTAALGKYALLEIEPMNVRECL